MLWTKYIVSCAAHNLTKKYSGNLQCNNESQQWRLVTSGPSGSTALTDIYEGCYDIGSANSWKIISTYHLLLHLEIQPRILACKAQAIYQQHSETLPTSVGPRLSKISQVENCPCVWHAHISKSVFLEIMHVVSSGLKKKLNIQITHTNVKTQRQWSTINAERWRLFQGCPCLFHCLLAFCALYRRVQVLDRPAFSPDLSSETRPHRNKI